MTSREIRIKRAQYRANHRGTKEMDLVLGRYAEEQMSGMSDEDLGFFEEFLALPDPEIDQWIKGREPPPGVAQIVLDIRRFHRLES
jgi:antitoxin CptB